MVLVAPILEAGRELRRTRSLLGQLPPQESGRGREGHVRRESRIHPSDRADALEGGATREEFDVREGLDGSAGQQSVDVLSGVDPEWQLAQQRVHRRSIALDAKGCHRCGQPAHSS